PVADLPVDLFLAAADPDLVGGLDLAQVGRYGVGPDDLSLGDPDVVALGGRDATVAAVSARARPDDAAAQGGDQGAGLGLAVAVRRAAGAMHLDGLGPLGGHQSTGL